MVNKVEKLTNINNYLLNKKHFENVTFKGYRKPTRHEQEMLFAWVEQYCLLTSRLDKYNIVYDLNEVFVTDNHMFCSVVEFIIFCFDILQNTEFYNKRTQFLLEHFQKLTGEIDSLINKIENNEVNLEGE